MNPLEVINYLYSIYKEGKLAHAFLVETNDIDKCFNDIKLLSKKILCNEEYKEECSICNICNLIDKDQFPSLKIVEQKEKKEITKDAIEELKHTFISKSSYTKNSIYIIKQPEKLNNKAYNILLKFLEEPEDNIIGFYITTLKEDVAPTIISRCEHIKMLYNVEKSAEKNIINNPLYTYAEEYINIIIKKEDVFWYQNNELIKVLKTREDIVSFFKILYTIYELKLHDKRDNYVITLKILKVINKYLEQLNYNVNINLLLNSFAIELGDIYGL